MGAADLAHWKHTARQTNRTVDKGGRSEQRKKSLELDKVVSAVHARGCVREQALLTHPLEWECSSSML